MTKWLSSQQRRAQPSPRSTPYFFGTLATALFSKRDYTVICLPACLYGIEVLVDKTQSEITPNKNLSIHRPPLRK